MEVNICAGVHPCTAPGPAPDYPRDRSCCRSACKRCFVAHQQDIHIYWPRSLAVYFSRIYSRPSCQLTKSCTTNLINSSVTNGIDVSSPGYSSTGEYYVYIVGGHRCAAQGCLPDFPRDRCCCRSERRRRPVAHQQDIHFYPLRSLTVDIVCFYSRLYCSLRK